LPNENVRNYRSTLGDLRDGSSTAAEWGRCRCILQPAAALKRTGTRPLNLNFSAETELRSFLQFWFRLQLQFHVSTLNSWLQHNRYSATTS
jgi:hypothetical protein